MKIYFYSAAQLVILLATSACVSVGISQSDIKRAKGVQLAAPSSPFQEIALEDVDRSWRNPKNGNTISYLSDCENPYDPSLEAIEYGIVSGLSEKTKVSTREEMYNDRASRQSIFKSKVDGIPSQVNLMVFKKNGCIFVISYTAVEKFYDLDVQQFDQFLKGFRAP